MWTLWLNLSARCLSWFTGRFNHPTPSDSTPSSRLWCIPTQCAAFPFLSGLSPLRSPLLHSPSVHAGALGLIPCCCQSWTGRRYPDLAIAVTPYQTQDSRQYEARARVSVFVEWSLRVIRPLADLGPPRKEQARDYILHLFKYLLICLVIRRCYCISPFLSRF